jgi:hypothetical protein
MRQLVLLFCICFLTKNISAQIPDSTEASESLVEAISASVQVDRKEVPQNRTFKFTLKISWQGDVARYEIEQVDNPVLTNFEVVGNSSANWVGEIGGEKKAIRTYDYTLKPLALGMGYIDGMIIDYKDTRYDETHSLVTNRLEVKVIDPMVETNWSMWLLTGTGIILLLGLSAATVIFIKRKNAREEEQRRQVMQIVPLEETFLNELKQKVDLKNPNAGESFSALSRLLKRYISERYQTSAMEITTPEIAATLKRNAVSEKIIEQAGEVLSACDVAKFSGGQVESGTLDRCYALVEDILNRNKREFIESTN